MQKQIFNWYKSAVHILKWRGCNLQENYSLPFSKWKHLTISTAKRILLLLLSYCIIIAHFCCLKALFFSLLQNCRHHKTLFRCQLVLSFTAYIFVTYLRSPQRKWSMYYIRRLVHKRNIKHTFPTPSFFFFLIEQHIETNVAPCVMPVCVCRHIPISASTYCSSNSRPFRRLINSGLYSPDGQRATGPCALSTPLICSHACLQIRS